MFYGFVKRLFFNFCCRICPHRTFAIDDDGDISQMKTTVTILNQDQSQGIFIDSYSCFGFLLNSGVRLMGPCAVFAHSALHWNVSIILFSVVMQEIFKVVLK